MTLLTKRIVAAVASLMGIGADGTRNAMTLLTKRIVAAVASLMGIGADGTRLLRSGPGEEPVTRAERLAAQSKRFTGNGPREVARRKRQIERGIIAVSRPWP